MAKIINITPNDDYTLSIELNNHHKIIYDMNQRLQAIRFGELNDMELFKQVRICNGNTLVWNDQCQITIDEIMSLIKR
ncbi:DUF2442 domain-containing protein [Anaerotignum sp.]|uniref:DUF2442 domain-containing protein n=1 Tax=Anaerotignum sp. TaxID=2039241 RepID=UPI00271457E2|nr:DUF2442 domain-containing protein [Anaerotignum sp.]